MFASLCWIAWNSAIRWPNACRSCAYESATSNAACAIPTACAAIPIRPPSSVAIAIRKPWCSSPINRSASTTVSKAMSFVTDELRPSFSSVRVIVTCSVSRMNAETPRALLVALSVRANRISVPPNDAFVIHCFAPVSCQPPCDRFRPARQCARVGARSGFRQREAPDVLAARERRHELRALRIGAELENRQRARRRVHGHRHADAGIRA